MREFKGNKVVIMSCSDCNTRCEHCYISYNGNFTGDHLFRVADNLMKSGVSVFISGTEPLMHQDFLRTYQLVGQHHALTNGLIFQNNSFDYLDEINSYGINALNISYHFDLHDQISKVPKVFLLELWREIVNKGMSFTINCTISTFNMHKIIEYCEEALSYGAFRIRFTNLLKQGNACALDEKLILSYSQIDEVIVSINKARKLFPKEKLYIERCGSFGANIKTPKFHCPAGNDTVVLAPNLMVYPCVFTVQRGKEIGFYSNGKIYINEEWKNNGEQCIALFELNHF